MILSRLREKHVPLVPCAGGYSDMKIDPELYEKLTSSSEISKEKSDTVADIESEPVVESTETEGT